MTDLSKVPGKEFKRAKVIYLCNAYTSKLPDQDQAALQREQRRDLEAYIAGTIKKKYKVAVIPPIAISAGMADICSFGHGFDEWSGEDYTFISIVDEVWVLVSDGWKESYGVQSEIEFAKKIGKPVKYILPNAQFIEETSPMLGLL